MRGKHEGSRTTDWREALLFAQWVVVVLDELGDRHRVLSTAMEHKLECDDLMQCLRTCGAHLSLIF